MKTRQKKQIERMARWLNERRLAKANGQKKQAKVKPVPRGLAFIHPYG